MNETLIVIIAFVVGTGLPLIFASFLPNSKFYNWGVSVGKKMSAAGRKISGWEGIENNLTGSFLSFAQGLKEGADEDDEATK